MINFLLGFLACYLISLPILYIGDPMNETVPMIYMAPAIGIWLIASFPFAFIYHVFIRLTIKPIEISRVITTARTSKNYSIRHVCGNLYFWHDKKTKNILNKFFLVRTTESLKLKNKQIQS